LSKIVVSGTGYVGLVTGTCFADLGNHVVCVDIDEEKIQKLQQGQAPIYEPGLQEMILRNVKAHRLFFTTSYEEALEGAEFIFIAVGTPESQDGSADMRYMQAAARAIGRSAPGRAVEPLIIVNKSTVPIGTGDLVSRLVREECPPGFRFMVVSNPEFTREGQAVLDFLQPDRVVLGSDDRGAAERVRELYEPLDAPVIVTDIRTAEMIKYASNAILATYISFINEIAHICDHLGADVKLVAQGMGYDKRINAQFLQAGLGFGGSCFPKDVKALIATARKHGLDFTLLSAVDAVNDRQKRLLAQKARAHFGAGNLRGKKLAVWGLAVKPKTDDLRYAPALALIDELLAEGGVVAAHDPVAMDNARREFGDRVQFVNNPYLAVEGADALFLVTEWNEFRQPDFSRIKAAMRQPVLFDGRNVWNAPRLRELGFAYYGVGRTA
jgi:UDPglucose 6-dehydrogenase